MSKTNKKEPALALIPEQQIIESPDLDKMHPMARQAWVSTLVLQAKTKLQIAQNELDKLLQIQQQSYKDYVDYVNEHGPNFPE